MIAKEETGIDFLHNLSVKVELPDYRQVLVNHTNWHYEYEEQLPDMLN
ncbi:hypothetical protein ACI2OX_04715 [Bacillus sp. N9]